MFLLKNPNGTALLRVNDLFIADRVQRVPLMAAISN